MKDLKLLLAYLTEHRATLAATVFGIFAGALLGALAYYRGWLG